jgi:hypothetical protein
MPLTDFPSGVSSFGIPQMGGGGIPATTGNVFFVDSGSVHAADGNAAKTPTKPAATIDGAIGKCTANNGDQIIVMPGHAESLTTDGQITMDVAGVSVFGLGQGMTRPTLTYDAAAGSVIISASNCRWSNIVHVASFAEVLNGITMNGTSLHNEIDHCRFWFDATAVEFTTMIQVGDGATASSDYAYIHDNWFEAEDIDGCGSAVLVDDSDFVTISQNLATGDFNSVVFDFAGSSSAAANILVLDNTIWNEDTGASIHLHATVGNGLLAGNRIGTKATTPEAAITDIFAHDVENRVSDSAVTVRGKQVPEATAT